MLIDEDRRGRAFPPVGAAPPVRVGTCGTSIQPGMAVGHATRFGRVHTAAPGLATAPAAPTGTTTAAAGGVGEHPHASGLAGR